MGDTGEEFDRVLLKDTLRPKDRMDAEALRRRFGQGQPWE